LIEGRLIGGGGVAQSPLSRCTARVCDNSWAKSLWDRPLWSRTEGSSPQEEPWDISLATGGQDPGWTECSDQKAGM